MEDEQGLEAYLDRIDADATTRAFCRELATEGVARIDLGDETLELCDRIAAEMDRQFEGRGARRIQDAWLYSRAVREMATLPKIRNLLTAAYDRPAFPFQTLNFRVGTEQHTHADAIHFHSVPERFICGVWVALEDIHESSGPLGYRPGSHRLPVLTMRAAGVNHARPTAADYERTYLPALARKLDDAALPHKTALLRRGQALVWTANLAHGGSAIANPETTRRSQVTHYYFKDCVYYTPMTSNVEGNNLRVRLPPNINTGGFEWPRQNGRLVSVDLAQLKSTLTKLLLRQASRH